MNFRCSSEFHVNIIINNAGRKWFKELCFITYTKDWLKSVNIIFFSWKTAIKKRKIFIIFYHLCQLQQCTTFDHVFFFGAFRILQFRFWDKSSLNFVFMAKKCHFYHHIRICYKSNLTNRMICNIRIVWNASGRRICSFTRTINKKKKK